MQTGSTTIDPSLQIRLEKRRLGLLFGMIAGLALSLGIWGWDALILRQVNSPDPFLKLLIGAPLVILLCGLAGWLTARLDHALLGALIWLLTALAVVALAAWVPFQALSTLVGLLSPEFAGLNIFPAGSSVQTRMVILMVPAGFLLAVLGALELGVLDGLLQTAYGLARGFRILLIAALFVAIGLLVDGLINTPLRRPMVAMHELIQFGRTVQAQPDLREHTNIGGFSTLRLFGDRINQPYRLSLATYDPDSMTETAAYLNFEGVWSTCFVVEDTPMNCTYSADRYLRRLACFLESAGTRKCDLRLRPGAEQAVQAISADLAGQKLTYGILDQRGDAVLVIAQPQGSDEQVRCVLRETGSVELERCEPTRGQTFLAVELPSSSQAQTTPPPDATPAAGAAPTPAQTPAAIPSQPQSTAADAAAALMPAAQSELADLPDLSRYTIDLTIDPSLISFDGSLQLDYTNLEAVDLDELYFRLLPNGHGPYGNGELRVTEALVAGELAAVESSLNDTVLRLELPQSLSPGEKTQVSMQFAGVVPEDFGGTDTPDGYGIYNLSDGVLALSGWYPILAVYDEDGWNLDPVSAIGDSVYSDTSLYSVRICAPVDLVLASTGVIVGAEEEAGSACRRIESGPVRDFFLAASRDFQLASSTVDGVTVNSYYLPGHESPGQQALEISVDSLEVYNEKFGAYPFVELDVIDAPMRNALGVEYPGIILVAQSLYDTPDRPEFAITTSHEVAHQWWYSVIGNDVFEEPWIDEALTSFSSTLYYEFAQSPDYAQGLWDFWQERYDQLKAQDRDDRVAESLEYFETREGRSYGTVVYTKGALFFKALRAEIGDDAFFTALQQYYRDHKYGIARGEDLLSAFEAAAGQQLDDFYREWLYSPQ